MSNKVEDIRSVIQHYNQFDDPIAKFRENQAALAVRNARLSRHKYIGQLVGLSKYGELGLIKYY